MKRTKPTPKPAAEAPADALTERALATLRKPAEALPAALSTELAAITASASKGAARAVTAAKALAKKLGDTAEAAAVYDAVAAAIFEHGGRFRSNASTCHAAARAIERKRKVKVDLTASAEVAEALAQGGAVWVKELVQLAKAARAAKRADLGDAITRASIATVRSGEAPGDDLLAALAALDVSHAVTALAAWIEDPKSLASFDDDAWRGAAPLLSDALDRNPDALASVIEAPAGAKPAQGWLVAMAAARASTRVAAKTPERAKTFAHNVLRMALRSPAGPDVTASLEALLPPLVAVMRARGEELPAVLPAAPFDSRTKLLAPELMEMLLSLDAPLSFEHDDDAVFDLYLWGEAAIDLPYQRLERVAAHPRLGPRLGLSLERSIEVTNFSGIVAKCAASPSTHAAVDHLVASLAGSLVTRGTLGAFEMYRAVIGRLCQPAVLSASPRLGDAVRALDAATLLQNQLRGGLLEEWGWAALDEATDRLGPGCAMATSLFPHAVLRKGDRVVVAGVDAIVLDHTDPLLSKDFQWLRAAVFVGGDLLIVSGDYKTRWLVSGESVTDSKLAFPALVDLLDRGGVMTLDGRSIRRGDTAIDPGLYSLPAHYDGAALHVRHGDRWARHEPGTGRALPDGAPAWIASREGSVSTVTLMAVPPRAVSSPHGARDGLGGFVSWIAPYVPQRAEGIDGRGYTARVGRSWYSIDALITFPEREGVHPVSREAGGTWVYLPDGGIPLVATDGEALRAMSADTSPRLPLPWWHLYQPRDLAASRALSRCTLEQAEALLSAAREALRVKPSNDGDTSEELTGYTGLRVTVSKPGAPVDALATWPAIADVARATLPDVTHPRVLAGVVRMAALAAETETHIEDLTRRVTAAGSGLAQSGLTNASVRRLDRFFEANFALPGRWAQDQLGPQIVDAAAFLFSDAAPEGERPVVTTVPPCYVAWERTLVHGAELFTALLGAGTSKPARDEIRAFLSLWRSTPFAAADATRCRVAGFTFASAPVTDLHRDRPDRLVAWENRYLLRWRAGSVSPCSFVAIEVTRDGVFRTPPCATLDWTESLDHNADRARIDEAVSLLDARGPAPLEESEVEALASSTGLLRDSAAVLLAGAQLVELDRDGRAALGTTASRLAYVADDLRAPKLHIIAASAVARDLRDLYERRADGETFARRLATAWNTLEARRPPLAVELVERIEEDVRNPHPPFLRAARALSSPRSFARFTASKRWVHRPFSVFTADALRFGSVPSGWPQHDDAPETGWAPRWPDPEVAFSYDTLAGYLKYLSWAHLELPVGDPLRVGAADLASLVEERLASPLLLLPAAWGPVDDLGVFERFIASLDAPAYESADGGASAAGVERRGVVIVWPGPVERRTGAFVSLRPAALTDEGLRALGLSRDGARWRVSVPGARFEALPYLGLFMLWRSEGFRALVAELRAPSLAPGSYIADPRVSAPEAVRAVKERYQIGDDEAALLLQIRWLAEPTPARVRRYNGWTRARYDDAAAVLHAKGLIEPVAYKGSPRAHGLPGPLAFFERYPAPIERSKLDAYGLTEGAAPPLDVPLPVCPVAELYARALDRRA